LRTFSKFLAGNPYLSVFVVGFVTFHAALASYSTAFAGVSGGAILMMASAYPYMKARKG
jgi:hypothetical protein